jgi:hypothetical protein
MRILYAKGVNVTISFGEREMKQALAVLKALATFFKADFIFKAAQELEDDLKPKPRISYTLYHHICEKCICEVDSREDNSLCISGVWKHKKCPTLKEKRPV